MGFIILILFFIDLIVFLIAFLNLLKAQEHKLLKLIVHPGTFIGLGLAFIFHTVYFFIVIQAKQVNAFDHVFTTALNFGLYPILGALLLSFFKKKWEFIYFAAHLTTFAVFFNLLLLIISSGFSENIYEYFGVEVSH